MADTSPPPPWPAPRRAAARRPAMGLLAMEGPRAAGEFAMFASFQPLLARAPRGDGHPVLVLPGLAASDRSTVPMRTFLRNLGYFVHGWDLGRNRPSAAMIEQLRTRFEALYHQHGDQPLSLVGWSLGGIYAREMARARPSWVRQVITLGSPFRDAPGEESHPAAFMRMANRGRPRRVLSQQPLDVPSTAIYSKTDGVVPWRAAVNVDGPRAESIEVVSSHVGLGHHPGVLWAVADRLAQPVGVWMPFRPGQAWSRLYPSYGTGSAADG